MRKWILGLALLVVGCGSQADFSSSQIQVAPGGPASVEQQRRFIIENNYPAGLIGHMQGDVAPVAANYPGTRPFSTAHYAQKFMVATLPDLYDVFDARTPANLEHFHAWAMARGLVLPEPPRLSYWAYSQAATAFLKEFGFDAAVFHPDEYHPAFTSTEDTWAFVREDVAAPGNYRSARFLERRQAIAGGMDLQPADSDVLWPFYVPVVGSIYTPYQVVVNASVSTFDDPAALNDYHPAAGNSNQIQARRLYGFPASLALSNRHQLRVGTWTNDSSVISKGFKFSYASGSSDQYTWGSSGHYILVLEPEFWVLPSN